MLHNTFPQKITIFVLILTKEGFFVTLHPIFARTGRFPVLS